MFRPMFHARGVIQHLNATKREGGGPLIYPAKYFTIRSNGSGHPTGAWKWKTFFAQFQARACNTLAFRRWRAWRRTDTGHAGRLHSRERARGRVQPRFRGKGGLGREKGAAATTAARRRRCRATPTGGTVTPPRSAPAQGGWGGRHGARAGGWDRPPRDGAPLTVPLDGFRSCRRAAATTAGAQARSPGGHRGRVEPRKSLCAVAARNSGRCRGAWGQVPSGPCDPVAGQSFSAT